MEQDEDGVTVEGRRFDWMVAADGLQSPIRDQLGLNVDARYPKRLGVRRHYNVAPWSEYVEVYWSEDAEHVTPVGFAESGRRDFVPCGCEASWLGAPLTGGWRRFRPWPSDWVSRRRRWRSGTV